MIPPSHRRASHADASASHGDFSAWIRHCCCTWCQYFVTIRRRGASSVSCVVRCRFRATPTLRHFGHLLNVNRLLSYYYASGYTFSWLPGYCRRLTTPPRQYYGQMLITPRQPADWPYARWIGWLATAVSLMLTLATISPHIIDWAASPMSVEHCRLVTLLQCHTATRLLPGITLLACRPGHYANMRRHAELRSSPSSVTLPGLVLLRLRHCCRLPILSDATTPDDWPPRCHWLRPLMLLATGLVAIDVFGHCRRLNTLFPLLLIPIDVISRPFSPLVGHHAVISLMFSPMGFRPEFSSYWLPHYQYFSMPSLRAIIVITRWSLIRH